jgi:hypothetical protein
VKLGAEVKAFNKDMENVLSPLERMTFRECLTKLYLYNVKRLEESKG